MRSETGVKSKSPYLGPLFDSKRVFGAMTDKPKLQNATKDEPNHEMKDTGEDIDMVTDEMEKEENSDGRIEDAQALHFQMDQEFTNRY